MRIESHRNPLFKKLLSLTKSKGLKEHQLSLVMGEKLTQEISKQQKSSGSQPLRACFWIKTKGMTLPPGAWKKTLELSQTLFKQLDVMGIESPLLCAPIPPWKPPNQLHGVKGPTLYLALSDPTNLGALIRTCAAFSWKQVVLLKEATHPFLPKAIRASSGTCFGIDFFQGPSIESLKAPGLVALDGSGEPLKNFSFPPHLKVLVGEEGQGVPDSFSGPRVQIPISAQVESLNATVAASLLIYEWGRRHQGL